MKNTAFLLLSLLSVPAFAHGACKEIDPAMDVDGSSCLSEELDLADAQMNRVYRELLAELDSNKDNPDAAEARSQLVIAQRAWIALRDSDCGAVSAYYRSGTIRLGAELSCELQRTRERTHQLEHLFDGP